MIAEIPSGAFEIPQYALWMIGGWILTTLITGWLGYRSGLRSQRHAEKLKAKIDVLSMIDSIIADLWNDNRLWNPNVKGEAS
jgi:hypothetical protein